MAFYVIGSRGRLGQAIATEFVASGIITLPREVYEGWAAPGADDLISRYFEADSGKPTTIFVPSGLLDPRLSAEELTRVNFTLPQNVIIGAARLGIQVITFGTVMEGLLKSKNAYVQSKTALGEYVRTAAADHLPVIHIQLHTLYGVGDPSPFMFLGLILAAIRDARPFKMTSGRQLREYHHFADDAAAIREIAAKATPGVVNLSHGRPVSLKELAEAVFQGFGKSDLLHLGALPEPPDENYEQVFRLTEIVQRTRFRESLPAIVEYMQECLRRQEGKA